MFAVGEGSKMMSTFLTGWMADKQGRAEQQLAFRDAKIAQNNAIARLMKARFDQLRAAEAGERLIGGMITHIGASGVRADVGAPMRMVVEQAKEVERHMTLIGYEAEMDAAQLRDEARMAIWSGKQARKRGRNIRRASLLQSFGQGAETYAAGKKEGFWGK
jgi:hypothetical protein